jgi:hypothetical protein
VKTFRHFYNAGVEFNTLLIAFGHKRQQLFKGQGPGLG